MSCQLLHLEELKKKQSWLAGLLQLRIKMIWSTKLLMGYCGKTVTQTLQRSRRSSAERPTVVELNAGDLVRVHSREEVERTLDGWNRYKGCTFVPEMYQYCNQTYRVLKRVTFFYDEVKQRTCTCRGVVFLRGVTCSGKRKVFAHPCDRNCFLFWRTVWLEKIEEGAEDPEELVVGA